MPYPNEIRLDYNSIRDTGLLWKINTLIHPLGIALTVGHGDPEEKPAVVYLSILVADDGVWEFTPEINAERKAAFDEWFRTTCEPMMTNRSLSTSMTHTVATIPECPCEKCNQWVDIMRLRFTMCPICGNKRCPKGTDHDLDCTGSNDPGQKGSSWERVAPNIILLREDGTRITQKEIEAADDCPSCASLGRCPTHRYIYEAWDRRMGQEGRA